VARALIDESKPEWVPEKDLIADGDPEVSYHSRPVGVETHRHLVKQHTSKVPNRRTHRTDDVVDFEAVSDAVYDYCLIGWKGIEADGKAVACDGLSVKKKLPGVLISAIGEYAMQTGGAHGRSTEERRESFRPTD
jgi:hypothetical protein